MLRACSLLFNIPCLMVSKRQWWLLQPQHCLPLPLIPLPSPPLKYCTLCCLQLWQSDKLLDQHEQRQLRQSISRCAIKNHRTADSTWTPAVAMLVLGCKLHRAQCPLCVANGNAGTGEKKERYNWYRAVVHMPCRSNVSTLLPC